MLRVVTLARRVVGRITYSSAAVGLRSTGMGTRWVGEPTDAAMLVADHAAPVTLHTLRVQDLSLVERTRIRMWLAEMHGWRTRFARFDWYVAAAIGDSHVSIAGVVERMGTIDGSPAHLGLLGAVLTPPSFRRRGLATMVVRQATSLIEDGLDCEFAVLTCGEELVPFYERLGWGVVANQLAFERFGVRRLVDAKVMVHEPEKRSLTPGVIDVGGLPA
jgi:GNAT superfamily N-acetyltransferase